MRFRMGPLEIGIILVIVLIIFGVGKLPQVGDALGKGIRAFRKGQKDEDEEKKDKGEAVKVETPPATQVTPAAEAPRAAVKETPPAKPGNA